MVFFLVLATFLAFVWSPPLPARGVKGIGSWEPPPPAGRCVSFYNSFYKMATFWPFVWSPPLPARGVKGIGS